MVPTERQLPLCIDLDGTLSPADMTVESILLAVKSQPWTLFFIPVWLLRGKAYLKTRLAALATLDMSVVPLDGRVLTLIEQAKANARSVFLVTGSHEKYACALAARIDLFDGVLATNADRNLTGRAKAQALSERFGPKGFDYAGNARVDLPIWAKANQAILVNASTSVVRDATKVNENVTVLPRSKPSIRVWLKALRVHQWSKNLLLFVPLITAHKLDEVGTLLAVVAAFLCFSFVASATYIVNDLLDLQVDRHHPTKSRRAFASGGLNVSSGLAASLFLLITGVALARTLPEYFQIALAVYFASTLLYSVALKRFASLDVIVLAGLYTLRVIAGALAVKITISFWLIAFSMFIFLCLALVKRVSELIDLSKRLADKSAATTAADHQPALAARRVRGREYSVEDIYILQVLGASSGYLSVLVLALYINSPEISGLYLTPQLLWLVAPLLLLWVTRLWVVTARGYMHDDPIVFAIKDPETWLTAFITAAILWVATVLQL
ncbi:MAG: UbiA family prenyltransferase [Gammaproteobacteria bacterium]|nr:UbiA family prenyltransferase [Gammaproteobacteria bacterium]